MGTVAIVVVVAVQGDVLATTCVFDTRTNAKWTWGGYGIEDEMCVNYVHYYPASEVQSHQGKTNRFMFVWSFCVQVEVCKTAVSNISLHAFFNKLFV